MLWIYAILDTTPPDLPATGIGGGPLELVCAGGLVAVATPIAKAPAADEAALRAHDRVVRHVAERASAVIPARFGQTAADAGELESLLHAQSAALAATLGRVRGCVQVTTRFFRDAGAPTPDVEGDTGAFPEQSGRAYLQRKLREERHPAALALCRELRPLARESRSRPGPAGALASAYHLVPRERADELIERARAFVPAAGTVVRVSGASPPYAFTGGPP